MADTSIGSLAGIVALASFAIKETFSFVKPLLHKKNGVNEVHWERVVTMMSEVKHDVADMKERHTDVLAELVTEQRKLNEYLLKQSVREEMRRENDRREHDRID